MRSATKEERESVNSYIESISSKCISIPIDENITNGDVIKALFPNASVYIDVFNNIHMNFDNDMPEIVYYKEWWNAPYKAESEEV